ncbi:hypothetical protein WN944_012820 [Citrus x changshan-huyou]|uniref:30S ribosomal protein S6 alpha n=3 Tax=Citrus TaxID=2706 RepID=A0ACB8LNV1_CITSI|nr:30S ribosomal protein S6 alpha [Citrus sinensis]KDO76604.1 hypothetical protein CISIN_1g027743mg [Citrus sinensis]
MASSSLTSALTSQSKSPFYPQQLSQLPSSPLFSFARSLKTFRTNAKSLLLHKKNSNSVSLTVKAQTLDFSGSFFEGGGFGSDDDPTSVPPGSVGTATAIEDKEEPQCPPGLRQYETMMVLRPDMSEDERLALTQKYEELLVAGGGMYVEVFNRGVIPLAYSIRKRNKAGESNTYLDGIYLLFTYFTKPESIEALERTMKADDDVIRSSSFKVRKQKQKG